LYIYDNGNSGMTGFNGEEFPKLPNIENKNAIKISGEIILKAVNKTLFATGNDDLRPVMSGVYCHFTPGDITFVATDAHKLVRYRRTDAEANGSAAFILPKKPLNMLKSNLRGDITIVCRLIEGKYPNYEAVIPKENPNILLVDRLQLLSSMKRVAIFANKTTHQIKMKLAGSELVLFAEDMDFSNQAQERLTCNYDGDDMEIGFNSRFLIEMLGNLDSVEVKLAMSEPSRAGLLTPATYTNENEDILMLVMPVMLNR